MRSVLRRVVIFGLRARASAPRPMVVAIVVLSAAAVAIAGCSGLPTQAADDAEERLTGSRLAHGERITRASCGELGDGDLECEVRTERGKATCTANGRDGTVRDLRCTKPE